MSSHSILHLPPGSTVDVGYQECFGSLDLKLLEVDDSLLQQILDHGVFIRGNLKDEAVLCTSDRTYAVKFVMTSNTVLIMPPPAFDVGACNLKTEPSANNVPERVDAMASVTGHIELVEIFPSIERLKTLLHQRPYCEDSIMDTDENTEGLYTFEDLLEQVQISEKELSEGLKALAAIKIGNFWRAVDHEFMKCLLDVILLSAVQHDWSWRALRGDQVAGVLQNDGYSPQIVVHCLDTFGHQVSSTLENERIWELDERLVCLHYAKKLLSSASRWKLDEFLEAWQQNVPSGMHTNIDMLKGEVLTDRMGSETWLRPFSITSLPSNPAGRFAALFRERSRWEWQDLEPYISDLKAPGKSVEDLLLKYTRKTLPTADASPSFTAR